MDLDNAPSASALTLRPPHIWKRKRSNDFQESSPHPPSNANKRERVFITHIRATTDVLSGPRPGVYVVAEIDGETTLTTVKPVSADKDAVEWDEEIPLPSERSTCVSFSVYASPELAKGPESEELLCEFNFTVGDLLRCDEQLWPIRLTVQKDDERVPSSWLSLRVIAERRACDVNSITRSTANILSRGQHVLNSSLQQPQLYAMRQIAQLTDTSREPLSCHQVKNRDDLYEAMMCSEQVENTRSTDHPHHTTELSELASVDRDDNGFLKLDMTITSYRNRLDFRMDSHADPSFEALDLSVALLARFYRRGDEADRTEIKDLLFQVMKLSKAESCTGKMAFLFSRMADIDVSTQSTDSAIRQAEFINLDDEELMRMAQVVLKDLPEDGHNWLALLGGLGRTLYRRFNDSGNLTDVHDAISILHNAVELVPDGHPEKLGWLDDLGGSFCSRFERLGDLADINKSIMLSEEAVRLTSAGIPDKLAARLNHLGSSLFRRFIRLGDLADVNKAISMTEKAIHLTTDDDPDKPSYLKNLGVALFRRFKRLGDAADINKAILVQQEAVHLIPDGHPEKPGQLGNLGNSLSGRFQYLGDLADINKAILIQEEAVHLIPDGSSKRPGCLNNLGISLSRRFERLGDIADMNKSILTKEEAVRLTPDGHPDKPARLNNLGNSFSLRFQRLGDLEDISKSILMSKEAVRLTPDCHPEKPTRLVCLGISSCRRFERLGDPSDINKSISWLEEAVGLTPNGHSEKPIRLNGLGTSLLRRFQHFGDITDINRSIAAEEEAACLTSDNHLYKPTWLNNLGGSFSVRFERLGDVQDITKSISMIEQAVRLTPDGHPEKPSRLSNLGSSSYHRFRHLGDLPDINKAILMFEEAVSLTPDDHPDKPGWLSNLGSSLARRYDRLGDLADLNKDVLVCEKALQLTPDSHPEKAAWLNNLGISLSRRFERLSDVADINRSIAVKEEAVRLTPNSYPRKLNRLNNLANALCSRFERFGDVTDIDRSISILEHVLRLTPDTYPGKSDRFNNLGNSLCCRFERFKNVSDIDKAISIYEEAVSLTPDGHPDRPGQLKNLGNAFIRRHLLCRDPSNLSSATSHFSLASRASTGSASVRFRASLDWINSARAEGKFQTVLDAYATAINILPDLAWLGLPLAERHRVLLEGADVARDAAAVAFAYGFPKTAIKWLEQGRSVVWGQFLQLRTPVDELRVAHPALAREFERISQQLEHAGSRNSTSQGSWAADDLVADTRLHEREVQAHHNLALGRERLLVEIRSLPGFDRFSLPKTIKQLAASAHSGPVVYLNASKLRCDAFILRAESDDVLSVSLPGVCYPEVERMHSLLRLVLEHNRLIISREDVSTLVRSEEEEDLSSQNFLDVLFSRVVQGSDRAAKIKPQRIEGYSTDEVFCQILAYLWNRVAWPVLEALGFSTPPSSDENLTRIFWCPTGPFSFLPIHAAGLYDTGPGSKLSDFVISSYIPTLSALAPLSQKHPLPTTTIHLTAVPQPPTDGLNWLALVQKEIDHIRTLCSTSPFVSLQECDGTIEDVVEKMKSSDWVHFACHGVQDPRNPLDSGLCLADGRRLKLSDIIRLSRPQGGLAFLSACQTAQGDEKLSEESVHLAAGMLLAGYGGVIGTMWAIKDPDAPRVARDVYEHLFFRDGKTVVVPESTGAAGALRRAVERLRDSGASFASWVPFIHVGR